MNVFWEMDEIFEEHSLKTTIKVQKFSTMADHFFFSKI